MAETEPTATDEVATDSDAESAEGAAPTATMHGVPVTGAEPQRVLHPSRDEYVGVVRALLDEGFAQLVDLVAVDYLTHPGRSALPEGVQPERFEVVIVLLSHEARARVRLRVQIPAGDAQLPTLTKLHPGADAFEREAWDMFGITFDGHPDLSRILMPEEWDSHPLRKDHAVGRVPVQFKGVAPSR